MHPLRIVVNYLKCRLCFFFKYFNFLPCNNSNETGFSTTKVNDLEFGDVDDVDLDSIPIKSPVGLTMKPEKLVKLSSSPLDLRTAMVICVS